MALVHPSLDLDRHRQRHANDGHELARVSARRQKGAHPGHGRVVRQCVRGSGEMMSALWWSDHLSLRRF
jgi:hypothetical protein